MRVGSICYATSQGLGHLAKDFYDAGIVTDVMVFKHPGGTAPSHMDWYPKGTYEWASRPFKGEKLERWLDDIDVVLCFETPFDWVFPQRCRERGVKTVIMPMYEWFLQRPPHQFDLFLNPSLLDQQYFPQGIFIPVPVRQKWTQRTHAVKWLHNAGNIGCRGHKGTLELLKAMKYVKSPIELTVRCQFPKGLRTLIDEAKCSEDTRIKFVAGEIPYDQLFADHDCVVVPEKFNGLSLPLQEAFASGMMVMTTDRFPTNTWLPNEPLIPVESVRRAQTQGGHLEFDECIVSPQAIAKKIDEFYGKDITSLSLLGKEYGEKNSWDVLKPLYIEAMESIL
jgi:hypothetical protein